MKKLKHNQRVKIEKSEWFDEIYVKTLKGFCGDDNERYCRAVSRGDYEAWSFKYPLCLTANYAGKDNETALKKDSFDNAVLIVDGEKVDIEGQIFIVKVNGLKYSDPISFVRVHNV